MRRGSARARSVARLAAGGCTGAPAHPSTCLYSTGPSSGSVVARGRSPVVDASRGRNDPRKATLGRRAWRGLDVSPASPSGERGWESPVLRDRAASAPAGECGGKDQVSRWRARPNRTRRRSTRMDLTFTGRGLPVTDEVRETAGHKLAHLERLEPRTTRIDLEFIGEHYPAPRWRQAGRGGACTSRARPSGLTPRPTTCRPRSTGWPTSSSANSATTTGNVARPCTRAGTRIRSPERCDLPIPRQRARPRGTGEQGRECNEAPEQAPGHGGRRPRVVPARARDGPAAGGRHRARRRGFRRRRSRRRRPGDDARRRADGRPHAEALRHRGRRARSRICCRTARS